MLTRSLCSHLDPTPDPAAPGVSACNHEVTSCLLIRSRHRQRPRQEKLTSRRTHFTLLVKLRGREACFLSHFLQTHVSGDKRTACSPPQISHHRSPSTAVLLFSFALSISPFFESNIYSRQPGILAPTPTYKSIMKRVVFLSQEAGTMPGLFCLCVHVCLKPAHVR